MSDHRRSRMPEQFRLGCPSIDTQHELIFAMYHELLRSQQQGEDSYELEFVFLSLNSYAGTHFRHEEDFMRACGFPGTEFHIREHRSLALQVGQLRGRFVLAGSQEEKRAIAGEVAVFLLGWLEHHIAEVDRELCEYLLEQGIDTP
ncbi:MAG: hemerythrin family protein [Magnetococcales bacterium]|nr:hemerythrin family protein [Magnetococcales bacterium]